jgi:hypothetical protein
VPATSYIYARRHEREADGGAEEAATLVEHRL